jgi:hypothetical protein
MVPAKLQTVPQPLVKVAANAMITPVRAAFITVPNA